LGRVEFEDLRSLFLSIRVMQVSCSCRPFSSLSDISPP
jgi:hypothetical protein